MLNIPQSCGPEFGQTSNLLVSSIRLRTCRRYTRFLRPQPKSSIYESNPVGSIYPLEMDASAQGHKLIGGALTLGKKHAPIGDFKMD